MDTRDVTKRLRSDIPQIAGYEIKEVLGKGGMAEVYLAFQENLDREVAIKVLDPLLVKDAKLLKRFIYEAKTAAKLIHSNIVTIHDVGRSGDNHYIVMEYLKESLRDRLKRIRKLPAAKALTIIKKIAQALFYAHNKGIIHRDIKPDNIMFRPDETPVLVDFGIARVLDLSTHLTMTGVRVGTPYYMSPEQCKGEALDGRSDIYSLGVVLFELLTGDVPYKSETPTGIIYQHTQAPLPALPRNLSKYQSLIDKMMAKKKQERIKNGKELKKIIESLEIDELSGRGKSIIRGEYPEEPSIYHLPETFIQRLVKQKRILAWTLAAVIVVLLGVMTYFIMKPNSKDRPIINSRVEKDTPKKQELSQEPIELPPSPDKQEKSKAPGNLGKTRKTLEESKKIPARDKKVDMKTPVQTKKHDEYEKYFDLAKSHYEKGNYDNALSYLQEAKKQKQTTELDIFEKEVITKRDEALEEEKVKTVELVDLDREIIAKIDKKLKRVEIWNLPEDIKAMGKIEFYLSVNEKGNIHIKEFNDTGLEVTPADKKEMVKEMISTKMNSISIIPPKDKTGEPIKIENWLKEFKVGTFREKIILY